MRWFWWMLLGWSLLAPVAWGQDITNNLTLHYKFDDGSGTTAVDSSGNGRNGTVNGTATWLSGGSCTLGGCLSFVPANSNTVTQAAILQPTLVGADTGTMAAWINPHGTPISSTVYGTEGIFAESGQWLGMFRGLTGGANDSFWAYNWDGSDDHIGVPYTVNTWVHIVWVHGGGNLSLYKNGVLATGVVSTCANANPCASGTTAGSASLRMGQSATGAVFLNAEVDDARTYTRALTPADVQALFEFGTTILGNRWRMMELERLKHTMFRWAWAGRIR